MNFIPLNKRILVKPEKAKEVSDGGILLAPQAQEKPARGEIIAISKDCDQLEVGQNVIYGKYAGNQIEIEKEKYVIIQEKELYGIIN